MKDLIIVVQAVFIMFACLNSYRSERRYKDVVKLFRELIANVRLSYTDEE